MKKRKIVIRSKDLGLYIFLSALVLGLSIVAYGFITKSDLQVSNLLPSTAFPTPTFISVSIPDVTVAPKATDKSRCLELAEAFAKMAESQGYLPEEVDFWRKAAEYKCN